MDQQSPEWFAARCGLATASRFSDILATVKSGEAAVRKNYRAQLVVERLTGKPADSYINAAMQHGIDNEPFARMALEEHSGVIVDEVGFVRHATLLAGASPDGLIGDDGLVEIKAPNTATHIEALLNGMPPGHIPQIQGQMWITGRQWCDFVSFDPRMPEHLQFYVQRIARDDAFIERLSSEVIRLLADVQKTIDQLNAIR